MCQLWKSILLVDTYRNSLSWKHALNDAVVNSLRLFTSTVASTQYSCICTGLFVRTSRSKLDMTCRLGPKMKLLLPCQYPPRGNKRSSGDIYKQVSAIEQHRGCELKLHCRQISCPTSWLIIICHGTNGLTAGGRRGRAMIRSLAALNNNTHQNIESVKIRLTCITLGSIRLSMS